MPYRMPSTKLLPSSASTPELHSIFIDETASESHHDGCCAGSCISCVADEQLISATSSTCPSISTRACVPCFPHTHVHFHRPRVMFLFKCIGFCVLILIGITIALVLYYTFRQQELVLFRRNLASLCQDRTKAIESSLSSITSVVYHYQGYYALALNQTRDGNRKIRNPEQISLFANYSRTLQLVDRIITVGYVNQTDRMAWESTRTITMGGPDNTIFWFPNTSDIDPHTALVRSIPVQNNKDIMYPLDSILPPVPRYELTGWDLSNYGFIGHVMTAAVESGTLQASNRSTLFSSNNTFGILVFLAVYNTPIPPTTILQRQAQAIGFVASVLPITTLLIETANTTDHNPVAITIYDRDSPESTSFLADLPIPDKPPLSLSENTSVFFDFGSRRYEMVCTPSSDFVDSGYSNTPLLIALGASILFIINFLLIILACVYLNMRRAVQRGEFLSLRNKQNDAALKVLQEAAAISQQANQSKSDFLAFLCHEIRNPLHSIVAMINFLESEEDGPLTQEQREHVETVQASVHSMSAIVNEALDMSKIEAGKLTFEVIPFSIPEVMKSITLSEQPRAQLKGLKLQLNMDPNQFPYVVYGDPTRFRQVVINVLSNAVKFTSHGSVSLTVSRALDASTPWSPLAGAGSRFQSLSDVEANIGSSVHPTTPPLVHKDNDKDQHRTLTKHAHDNIPNHTYNYKDNDFDTAGGSAASASHISHCCMLEVKVSDTGVGIPPEAFVHLFEPYSQAKLSVMRMFGGTGLGLAIAKQLVDQAGGSISLDSEVGRGTAVTIHMPFRLAAAPAPAPAAPISPSPVLLRSASSGIISAGTTSHHNNDNHSSPLSLSAPPTGTSITQSISQSPTVSAHLGAVPRPPSYQQSESYAGLQYLHPNPNPNPPVSESPIPIPIPIPSVTQRSSSSSDHDPSININVLDTPNLHRCQSLSGDGHGFGCGSGSGSGTPTPISSTGTYTETCSESCTAPIHATQPAVNSNTIDMHTSSSPASASAPVPPHDVFTTCPEIDSVLFIPPMSHRSTSESQAHSKPKPKPSPSPSSSSSPRLINIHDEAEDTAEVEATNGRLSGDGDEDGDGVGDGAARAGDGGGGGGGSQEPEPHSSTSSVAARTPRDMVEMTACTSISKPNPSSNNHHTNINATPADSAHSDSSSAHPRLPTVVRCAGGSVESSPCPGRTRPQPFLPQRSPQHYPRPLSQPWSSSSSSSSSAPSSPIIRTNSKLKSKSICGPATAREGGSGGGAQRQGHQRGPKRASLAHSGCGTPTWTPPTLPRKLLVVDDSTANLKILCRMLRGHDITTAMDGQQAVDAVKQLMNHPEPCTPSQAPPHDGTASSSTTCPVAPPPRRQFDMIFTDIVMPVMDGLSSARSIRSLEQSAGLPACPIVAVTANSFPQDREACSQAGINYFLSKPFQAVEVLRFLDTLDQTQPASAAAAGAGPVPVNA